MGMDLRVMAAGDRWVGGMGQSGGGGSSHDGEHDLGLMVRDFLETGGGSGGGQSWCSSDSDSGCSDLSFLSDKIQFFKYSMAQREADVLSVVCSQIFSIRETDLHSVKSGTCNASCIRFYLAKLLRLTGYDAAVCSARWQGSSKVPGGEHEYIDVILSDADIVDHDERLIVDIDFRSHFEIARAVDSYQRILDSLPVVYVGSLNRLNQFLRVMADAAKSSLKQNSMPLPPWRSLPYLQSKWNSPYKRHLQPTNPESPTIFSSETHKKCAENLKRVQLALQAEQDGERLLKLIKMNNSNSRRMKPERTRDSTVHAFESM